MTYSADLSPKAEKELYDAVEWYEGEQPGVGENFEKEFFRKVDLIKNNPLHYPLKKGLRRR